MNTANAQEVDYAVIGGGSAGCTVAGRLSEDADIRVVVLEAGGDGDRLLIRTPAAIVLLVPARRNAWMFETVPQASLNQRRGFQPRGKVLGGSSAVNDMAISVDIKRITITGAPWVMSVGRLMKFSHISRNPSTTT